MEIQTLKIGNMVMGGGSALRGMQNNAMPKLDLFIREVLQNSSDAKRDDKTFIRAEINVGDFDSNQLSKKFNKIENKLENVYEKNSKFISVKDSNTVGLTGEINIDNVSEENYGRFLNLITSIGKAQEKSNAGGSWGYGKTIYYRLGIGLVIYYSRVKYNGEYQSRLMASLIEDEKKADGILVGAYENEFGPRTGMAWWGTINRSRQEERIEPITNEDEINEILNCFNILPYGENETGTTVIIPYVNEEKLLKETTTSKEMMPWWCNSISDYFSVAVQRWYSTKLKSKFEDVEDGINLYINGEEFSLFKDGLPLFKIVNDLYRHDESTLIENIIINEESINLVKMFEGSNEAGVLYYTVVSKEKLKMEQFGNEPSPYTQINNIVDNSEYTANNIICFCRKPGMILKYDIDGSWTSGIVSCEEDSFLIGLFIPNSNNIINSIECNEKISLEEYLRAGEKADHMEWVDTSDYTLKSGYVLDLSNLKIVSKIQTNIKNRINKKFEKSAAKAELGVGTELNRRLAELFLPKKGFGKKPTTTISGGGKTNSTSNFSSKIRMSSMELFGLEYNNENLSWIKNLVLKIAPSERKVQYRFSINTDGNNIKANKWEEEGLEFPVAIKAIYIESLTMLDGSIVKLDQTINQNKTTEYYNFRKLITSKMGVWYGFSIEIINSEIISLKGKMEYEYYDKKIEVSIDKGGNDEQ